MLDVGAGGIMAGGRGAGGGGGGGWHAACCQATLAKQPRVSAQPRY